MQESFKVLEPKGILDNTGGNQIRQEVIGILEAGIGTILIDLTSVSFMDSSGLGEMVATLQRVRTKKANLYLCSLHDQLRIIMEITRMDKAFNILPDRSAFDMAMEN